MVKRLMHTDRWLTAGTVLAVVAVLLLGWQVADVVSQLGAADTPPRGGTPYGLLVIALVGLASVAVLLTALLRSERARTVAETRLHRMAYSLPGAFYVFRLTEHGAGTYEFLTDNAGSVLGVPRELVVQDARVAQRMVVPEDVTRMDAAIARSRTDLSPLELDFRIRKQDGHMRWIRTLAVPVREANQDVVWNGHLLDITDLRSAEQALRDAHGRLEDAQSVARFGDWTCNLGTGAMTWSPQVYRLLEREPALGPPGLAEVLEMMQEGPQPTADAFEAAQETGQPQSFEGSARLPSGKVIALHVIVLPVDDGSGQVTGMRGTIQDITERKALEGHLSQAKEFADSANRAKSSFLATMSHEIRNLLNGMLGIVELISLTPVNPEIRTGLDAVQESGESLQRIIDDILDFSKVEAGKLEIHLEPTRLADVIDAVHRIYAGSAYGLGLELVQRVDPAISPILLLDALRLRQILGNFVSNAIKFTPKGSVELRVSLAGRDGDVEQLRFEVVDTGIGISEEAQRTLFQPFEQVSGNANRYGGTGLGLSISRKLAELMAGRVGMRSAPGAGTIMTLDIAAMVVDPALLPARGSSAPERGAADILPPSEAMAANGLLILVVDDHPINRMVMRRQINALGYAADEAEGGAEALALWRTGRYALVVTDCNMPGISGYDLSRLIREAEAGLGAPRTPIIACSANVIPGVVQDCLDAGMDDYIAKPTKLEGLSEKLARWLPAAQAAAIPESSAPAQASARAAPAAQPPKLSALSGRALAHFREINEADVRNLLQAVAGGDLGAVAHLAHRIRGACGFIGATGLASVCAMIEQAARDGDGSGVAWLMDTFHIELEQLNATLDA